MKITLKEAIREIAENNKVFKLHTTVFNNATGKTTVYFDAEDTKKSLKKFIKKTKNYGSFWISFYNPLNNNLLYKAQVTNKKGEPF